jgi:predicted nuclease of predicted toxin-antitoxin system
VRFLADENFPGPSVRILRDAGHDVVWIRETSPGIADPAVLERAQREVRVLLTSDKDFGELAFRVGLPATAGVVLCRLFDSDPSAEAKRIVLLMQNGVDWVGHFSVIQGTKLRQSPLPPQKST